MRRKEPLNPRNLGAAAVALDEYLRSLGITDITYTKTKHIQVEFMCGPRRVRMSLPCTPRDDTTAAHQAVWSAKRKLTQVLTGGQHHGRSAAR